ncbi:hypothetical protein BH11PSE13_BH11PSE13_44760 [soil metagenome]
MKLPAKPVSKPVSKPAEKATQTLKQAPKPAAVVQPPPAEKTRQAIAKKPALKKASPIVPVKTKAKAPTVKPVAVKKPQAAPKSSTKAVKPSDARKVSEKTSAQKDKLVRDSFTMPQDDYALIARLKDRAVMFKRPAKKSELLRAGLHALQAMSAPALRAALDALTPLKSGRPKKQVD